MRVFLTTLGCRLNEAEIETWGIKFGAAGHALVDTAADADLIVLNTCAVTAEAVRKSRKSIQRLQRDNPRAKLVVSGCYVSLDDDTAVTSGIDLVVPNHDKDALVTRCQEAFDSSQMPAAAMNPATALFQRNRQRAFVKVQDGCRYRCTFCIVTVARGDERSRSVSDIVNEINQLSQSGIQEVVLTGVHVGGYGSDLDTNLYSLVQHILRDTDIPRIRFASVEPWDLQDNFFSLFADSRLMPHMHLPLQSGCDSVLKRMARRCKTADFSALLQTIRTELPHFNITTDIIVGFPGETDDEWKQSLAYVEAQEFGHIHIFSYSVRAGTKAARLPDQVHGAVKRRRSRQLHEHSQLTRQRVVSQQLTADEPVAILWESGSPSPVVGKTRFLGYTPNYHRVQTDIDASTSLANALTHSSLCHYDHSSERLVADHHELLAQPSHQVLIPLVEPQGSTKIIQIHPQVGSSRPTNTPTPPLNPTEIPRSKAPSAATDPQIM